MTVRSCLDTSVSLFTLTTTPALTPTPTKLQLTVARCALLQAGHTLAQLLLGQTRTHAPALAAAAARTLAAAPAYAATACLTGALLFLMPVMAAGRFNSAVSTHTGESATR